MWKWEEKGAAYYEETEKALSGQCHRRPAKSGQEVRVVDRHLIPGMTTMAVRDGHGSVVFWGGLWVFFLGGWGHGGVRIMRSEISRVDSVLVGQKIRCPGCAGSGHFLRA